LGFGLQEKNASIEKIELGHFNGSQRHQKRHDFLKDGQDSFLPLFPLVYITNSLMYNDPLRKALKLQPVPLHLQHNQVNQEANLPFQVELLHFPIMASKRTLASHLCRLLISLLGIVCVLGQKKQDDDPLSVLGEGAWTRLRPGWSLTVNDQCLYEFVFQFEHDANLPMGDPEFLGSCTFGETRQDSPETAPDGKLYLEPRQMWERFPDYVWATIGFNHLSVDWHPCGHQPRAYSIPHYDFSVGDR
jgi:hypothetical protein